MRRNWVLVISCVVMVAVLAFTHAILSVQGTIRVMGSDSIVQGNVSYTLVAEPQELQVGETVNITVTATNLDTVPKTMNTSCGPNVFDIIAYNASLQWRWSDGQFWIFTVYPPITLQPGESYNETKNWNLFIYKNGTYFQPQEGFYILALDVPLQDLHLEVHVIPEVSVTILSLLMVAMLLGAITFRVRKRSPQHSHPSSNHGSIE